MTLEEEARALVKLQAAAEDCRHYYLYRNNHSQDLALMIRIAAGTYQMDCDSDAKWAVNDSWFGTNGLSTAWVWWSGKIHRALQNTRANPDPSITVPLQT